MVKKNRKTKSVTDYNDLKPKFDLISVGFFLKKKNNMGVNPNLLTIPFQMFSFYINNSFRNYIKYLKK
jgi:hypothetical protein